MTGAFSAVDRFLRVGARGPEWAPLATVSGMVGAGAVYGAVMASFGGVTGERLWMVAFGAAKVPLLFTATMLIAVPSFYVLNVLAGVGADFPRVWRGLVDYQLALGLLLAALAPVTGLVNLLTDDYRTAQAWSSLVFGVVSWSARPTLDAAYGPLLVARPAHRRLRLAWVALYAFIGVQMAWDLRPFVGNPAMEVQFFRDEIGNAYVEVGRVLLEAAGF